MGSSQTLSTHTSETNDTPTADPIAADAIASATTLDFAPAYLAGYFGEAVRYAAEQYPDDTNLRRAAALFQAWKDRAYDSAATIAGGAK
ncbi:hypothetical protein [Micromonospora sp. NPDC049891]|uniref:hypothetical protein n=1 Tax=Micromonospora sp. NPDC049891 TaxID=3155655 RepID=UPI0033EDD457